MIFISVFLLVIQENTEDEFYKRENILLKDIALTVQNEINLATKSSDGYKREFELPRQAGSLNYNITIDSGAIYIRTIPLRHALSISAPNVTGNINITHNKIEKISGEIYLNKWNQKKRPKCGAST